MLCVRYMSGVFSLGSHHKHLFNDKNKRRPNEIADRPFTKTGSVACIGH